MYPCSYNGDECAARLGVVRTCVVLNAMGRSKNKHLG